LNALKISRFFALLFTALLMGSSFAHYLEMAPKMEMTGPEWLALQQQLYVRFATIGGPVEIAAILCVAWLCYCSRRLRTEYKLSLPALILLLIAFFGFWLRFNYQINEQTAKWTMETIPKNWMMLRAQWEYSHAVRFWMHLIGFGALLISVLIKERWHYNSIHE
jgi:membrane associated rhomboid family serine protease